MAENLLQAPERDAIEAFLRQSDSGNGERPSYERLLGFLSGVVITPGHFMPSEWLQPLLDLNGIVFDNIDDANRFMGALMPLYNRVNAARLRNENLCPFNLSEAPDLDVAQRLATEWGMGLHGALILRAEIWAPEEGKARHIPEELLEEVQVFIPFLWALAEPDSIPEIVPDPVPFQRNLLSQGPGWQEDMLRDEWDEELIELFKLFCLGRLGATTSALQRYAKAYEKGVHAHASTLPIPRKSAKVGRNEPCPCGSGLKFKKCCGA
ncbi:MAG: UPF0149 family protein [Geobacteraceae bacterium]|nr:UPF0149 family protein [Geobacteraceae bacterium]